MTDKITEFINTTNLSYADLISGVTIVSNPSTESAVIKDVAVTNTRGRPLVISVGGTVLARANGTCQLSGSELVAPGTSMKLKLASGGLFNEFYVLSGAQVVKYRCSTIYDKDGAGSLAVLNVSNVGALNGTPAFMCFDLSGNFYYACYNNSNLYRRVGGVSGAESSFAMGNTTYCYDGSRYIYCFSQNEPLVYTFDTQFATVTSKSCGFNTSMSTAYASALDGRIYVKPGSGSANWLVNPATGQSISLPGLATNGNQFFVGLGKDDQGNYIAWQTDNIAPHFNWWNLGKDLAAPIVQALGEISGVSNFHGAQDYVGAVRQMGSASVFCFVGQGAFWKFDARSKELINLAAGPGGLPTGHTGAFVPPLNTVFAAEDIGIVGVRATGVRST